MKVAIYNEFRHEQNDPAIAAVYPKGIHGCLKDVLACEDIQVDTYTLETVNDLTAEALRGIDVLIWWGHMAHNEVPDEVAVRVRDAVQQGMGIIFLHSAHESKPFKLLLGTCTHLGWREDGDMERVWTVRPAHPIAQGIGRYIRLPHEETYSEPFGIPEPDEVVFIGWYEGGEVFRSGVTFHRDNGRIFYFQPGHEAFPTYFIPEVQTVLRNAVRWAAPVRRVPVLACDHIVKLKPEE